MSKYVCISQALGALDKQPRRAAISPPLSTPPCPNLPFHAPQSPNPLNQILIITAYMADVGLCLQLDPNDLP